MADKGDLTNRQLLALRRLRADWPTLVNGIRRRVAQRWKSKEQNYQSELFDAEKYIGASGRARALGRISSAYRRAKARQGYDVRRGHRTGELEAAINDMVRLTPNRFGIRIALRSAASSKLRKYLDYYEESKAPGLGSRPSLANERWAIQEAKKLIHNRVRQVATQYGIPPANLMRFLTGRSEVQILRRAA